MKKATNKRFYIDLAPEDDALLNKLSKALTAKLGLRVTRINALRAAIRAMAKWEGA